MFATKYYEVIVKMSQQIITTDKSLRQFKNYKIVSTA